MEHGKIVEVCTGVKATRDERIEGIWSRDEGYE